MMTGSPLFILSLAVAPVFIIAGLIMRRWPPKNINYIYGDRTSNSMHSQERWDFAQVYSAKEMIKMGLVLILTSIIGLFLKINETLLLMLGLTLLIAMAVLLIIRVERAIKSKFGKK